MSTKISVQLFTVRKHLKTHDQIISTLHKLNAAGIRTIEVAGVKFTKEEGEIIASTCHKLGIQVGGTLIEYKKIIRHFDEIIALHQLWACNYMAVSVMPVKYMLQGEKGVRKFASLLNALGERLHKRGLHLLYHHHNFEYIRYGEKTGLEIIMEATNPIYVNLVMDTYWTQRGGKNPVDQIHQFHERIKVIHMRDYKIEYAKWTRNSVIGDCAVGEGNLDMKGIVETAASYNIPFLPIEQDTEQPFVEIKKSVETFINLGFVGLL